LFQNGAKSGFEICVLLSDPSTLDDGQNTPRIQNEEV
jgi:hypothetical protein